MADSSQKSLWTAPAEKENQPSAAVAKKGGGGGGGGAATKKPKDTSKALLRLPTPATLRKAANVDDEVVANTDPKAAKKFGKDNVKQVHYLVDADWHDGGEEQSEALFEYFKGFEKFARGVFDLAILNGIAFERCHEVMKALADSWENMKSIPARSGVEENFDGDRKMFGSDESEIVKIELGEGIEAAKFDSPGELFSEFWPLLLWAAASSSEIEDSLLYRWMKDASDYGANFSKGNTFQKMVAGEIEAKNEAGKVTRQATPPTLRSKKDGMDLRRGIVRFLKLYDNRSLWANLQSCKVSYKRKRVLDRRYDGPKNRRTRDFDSYEYEGFF